MDLDNLEKSILTSIKLQGQVNVLEHSIASLNADIQQINEAEAKRMAEGAADIKERQSKIAGLSKDLEGKKKELDEKLAILHASGADLPLGGGSASSISM